MDLSIKEEGGYKIKINLADIKRKMVEFWMRRYMLFFFAFLVVAIFLGWYFWQKSIGGAVWSEERKSEYLKAQNREIILNEKEYDKVIEEMKNRKEERGKTVNEVRDLFKPY